MDLLRGEEARREVVDADDRDDDSWLHARLGAERWRFRDEATKNSVAGSCSIRRVCGRVDHRVPRR
jgi:hypothetical protein